MTMLCHSGETAAQIRSSTAATGPEDINSIPMMRLVLAAAITLQVTLVVVLVFPLLDP
jgi:hypothetical protein